MEGPSKNFLAGSTLKVTKLSFVFYDEYHSVESLIVNTTMLAKIYSVKLLRHVFIFSDFQNEGLEISKPGAHSEEWPFLGR